MWNKTRVTEILNIDYPIILGPMGVGYSTVDLVAKVSNKGGLGSYGAVELSPQEIIDVNKEIRAATSKPYSINLWVSDKDESATSYQKQEFARVQQLFKPYFDRFEIPVPGMPSLSSTGYEEKVQAVLEASPPAFSFIFGIPSGDILRECKKRGIKTIGSATTPDEAVALEKAGVDLVVASGFEAGGHRGSFLRAAESSLTGTFSLVPQVVDKISLPVIAAGGIADGRGVAAAMMLGAEAVQIGTAFLACDECNASAIHKERLFSEHAQYTVLTKLFSGRLARTLSNKVQEEMQQYENEFAPFPLQRYFMRPLFAKIMATGDHPDYLPYMSGQSAPLLKYRQTEQLFDALVNDAGNLLSRRW